MKIEDTQTHFARRLLTLSQHAPAVFLRSELGLESMASRGFAASLKFFGKLVHMPQTRLASFIFHLRCDHADGLYHQDEDPSTHRLGQYSWCLSMKNTLTDNKYPQYWRRRAVPANWSSLTRNMVALYEQHLVNNEFARLHTLDLYRTLPRSAGPEKWMNSWTLAHPGVRVKVMMRGNCAPVFERVGATRDYEIPGHARVCKFCATGAAEDVVHVVSACPLYADIRQGCMQRLEACMQGMALPAVLSAALADRTDAGLARLFLGDAFHGLAADVYRSAHSIVLNYLKLLWKRRTPLWASFCVKGNEWQLLNPPNG
jgi:hypothetical protein